MNYFIGADPDIRDQSIACISDLNEEPYLEWVYLSCVPKTAKTTVDAIVHQCRQLSNEGFNALADFGCGEDSYHVAVEGQNVVYTAQKGANPQSLVDLATVGGGCLTLISTVFGKSIKSLKLPKPSEWKGNVPKLVCQSRALDALRIEWSKAGGKEPYCVPDFDLVTSVGGNFTNGKWKDAMDSVALAYWSWKKFDEERKKAKWKGKK